MATKIKRLSSYDNEEQRAFLDAVVSGEAKATKPMTLKGIEKAFLMNDGDDTLLVLIDLNFAMFEGDTDIPDMALEDESEDEDGSDEFDDD